LFAKKTFRRLGCRRHIGAGITLEKGIGIFSSSGMAYRSSFIVLAAVGTVDALLAMLLKENVRK
jgi:hypothetical protein